MTVRDLLKEICVEGILVINKYNKFDINESERLFNGLEVSGQWNTIQDHIKDMEIKYMYATTYGKAAGIETAALILEVEEN